MSKVLVIDDDALMSEMLCDMIEGMDHEATARHTLAEGRKAIESASYDVVYLDIQLPDGNGLDMMSIIQSSFSHPEIIIITAFGDPGGAELAIRNGAWSYIEKGSSLEAYMLPLVRALDYREAKNKSRPFTLQREDIIGRSRKMEACFDLLSRAAKTDLNVLITGETGTGKECFARAIHRNSDRKDREMVTVDCAALPPSLVESVLFGHEKGAFTSADAPRDGLIKQADGGTLFLDEVGDLPLPIQKEFLRVLQEKRFRPIGSRREICSSFRLISATNRNLDAMVSQGQLRSDLYYRLHSLTVTLPPLRERTEDIVDLFFFYMQRFCSRHSIDVKGFSPEYLGALKDYEWPGNVRELINTIEQSLVVAFDEPTLYVRHLPEDIRINLVKRSLVRKEAKRSDPARPLETWKLRREKMAAQEERRYLEELMEAAHGDIPKACQISGLSRARLYSLFKSHKFERKGNGHSVL